MYITIDFHPIFDRSLIRSTPQLVFIQLIGSCGIAALGAFAYLYAAMCGKLDWLKRRRVLVGMALVQLFYSTPCALIRALLQVKMERKANKQVESQKKNAKKWTKYRKQIVLM